MHGKHEVNGSIPFVGLWMQYWRAVVWNMGRVQV